VVMKAQWPIVINHEHTPEKTIGWVMLDTNPVYPNAILVVKFFKGQTKETIGKIFGNISFDVSGEDQDEKITSFIIQNWSLHTKE